VGGLPKVLDETVLSAELGLVVATEPRLDQDAVVAWARGQSEVAAGNIRSSVAVQRISIARALRHSVQRARRLRAKLRMVA
jgi:hypothetical protein